MLSNTPASLVHTKHQRTGPRPLQIGLEPEVLGTTSTMWQVLRESLNSSSRNLSSSVTLSHATGGSLITKPLHDFEPHQMRWRLGWLIWKLGSSIAYIPLCCPCLRFLLYGEDFTFDHLATIDRSWGISITRTKTFAFKCS